MKPPLLLIAGWAFPAAALEPLAERLATLFTTRTIAADEFDPHAPLAVPTHLLGWSLGGMLALEAAAAQPALVQSLFLINTTPRFTTATDWPHGLPPAEVRALSRALRKDVAAGLAGFLALNAKPHSCTTTLPAGPLATLEAGLRYLGEADLRPLLSAVACPALVIHARADAVIPPAAGARLATALPSRQQVVETGHAAPLQEGLPRRLVVVDGIGHDLPVRSPGIVADAVRTFHAGSA